MIDPSIALQYRAPDGNAMLQGYHQAQALGQMGLQQAMQAQRLKAAQLENQQHELGLADQQKLQQAWTEAGGDGDKLFTLATQKGVSPALLLKLKDTLVESRKKIAELSQADLEMPVAKHTRLQSVLAPIVSEKDPSKQAALWQGSLQQLQQSGEMTAEQAAQYAYPGSPEAVQNAVAGLNFEKWTLSQQQQATTRQHNVQADIALEKQNIEAPGQIADAEGKQRLRYAQARRRMRTRTRRRWVICR